MKKITFGLLVYFFIGTANASLITIDHNITYLPSSGYFEIDLDDDGLVDINLASNFYVSVWSQNTEFTTPYSLIGDVIDANNTWRQGNTWLDLYGSIQDYVQDDLLYLSVRNTTVGDYYGYITFNYNSNSNSNSVSLNSYTYENSGAAITVGSTEVPEPTSLALLGLGLAGFGFMRKKKA